MTGLLWNIFIVALSVYLAVNKSAWWLLLLFMSTPGFAVVILGPTLLLAGLVVVATIFVEALDKERG